jgi:hypothetical protein
VDLRAHLAFQPGTWRQHANDCYAWATQAALMCEMATHPAIRIRDQLTVNLWHSKYHPTPLKDASGKDVRPSNEPSCSLNMSTPTVLERSYNQWRMLMPASNPNGMAAPASGMAVGVNPHYRIKPGGFRLGTVDAPFKLTHVGIDLIKNKLSENKVIIYRPSDRAHFMAIVGYDATGADESKHSWLVLDSAGGAEPYRRIPIGGADFPPGGVIPVECSFDYIDKLELDLDPEGPPRAVKVTVPGGDDSVHLGGPLTLWAEAQGRGPMRYQWLKDGAPITGATGSTLEFPAFRPEDAGTYQVQVTNDWGPVRSRGKVFAPAQDAGGTRLFLSPKGALLGPGQALTIRATVGGDGRATGVAWRLGAGDPGSLEAQGPFTVVYRAPRDMQAGTRLHARVTAVTRGAAVETAAVLDIPLAKLAIHPGEALDARLLLDLARARRTAHGDPKFSKRCDMNKDGRVTKQDEIQFIRQLKENL